MTGPGRRGKRLSGALLFVTALLAVCGLAGVVQATPVRAVYTIAIGVNDVPGRLRTPDNEGLSALRYADDDASSFYVFLNAMSKGAYLLSVLDADTQKRFPELVNVARVPSRSEIARVVEAVAKSMAQDRAEGREPELIFFYSGHGVRDEKGAAGLALFDGALSQTSLYEDLLAKVPARFVHLIVDACHAEAVVRPRDADARVAPLAPSEQTEFLHNATLARFPHVGALLASAVNAQSFEWEAYRGGVFAHEVLSGLRGGADVNGDGRVEYSELAAFLAAANLQIAAPEARLQVVIQPPRTDQRAAIVDLAELKDHFRLSGRAHGPWSEPFYVETDRGVRLIDVHSERDAPIAYRLPAGVPLFVIGADGEAELTSQPGAEVRLDSLKTSSRGAQARGSIQSSIRRGLFATAFGPGFYRGYVSRESELVAVALASDLNAIDRDAPAPLIDAALSKADDRRRMAGRVLLAAAGAGAVSACLFGALAWNAQSRYEATPFEREAAQDRTDFDRDRTWAWVSAIGAGVSGVAAGALLLWPNERTTGRILDGLVFSQHGLEALGRF